MAREMGYSGKRQYIPRTIPRPVKCYICGTCEDESCECLNCIDIRESREISAMRKNRENGQ